MVGRFPPIGFATGARVLLVKSCSKSTTILPVERVGGVLRRPRRCGKRTSTPMHSATSVSCAFSIPPARSIGRPRRDWRRAGPGDARGTHRPSAHVRPGPVCAGRRGLSPRPRAPRFSHRHEPVPRVSISCDREGVGIRVRVITTHRDARLRPPAPLGRSPPSRHVASLPCASGAAGRRDRPRRAVAHGPVPRAGVRDGVLPLWVLLPGAGLLRGSLPRDRATPSTAARDRQAPA